MGFDICEHQLFNTGLLGVMTHPYFLISILIFTGLFIAFCLYCAISGKQGHRFGYAIITVWLSVWFLYGLSNVEKAYRVEAQEQEMFKDCK